MTSAMDLGSHLVLGGLLIQSAHGFRTTPFPRTLTKNDEDGDRTVSHWLEADGGNRTNPATSHQEGPLPLISDSLFSLIILIYVSVIFVFVFFSFCWKEPDPPPNDPNAKDIPMITSMLEEMEKEEMERKTNGVTDHSDTEMAHPDPEAGVSSTSGLDLKPILPAIPSPMEKKQEKEESTDV